MNSEALKREVDAATRHVVARQREVGIDVANDGEQSRESFITYVQHRLSGYGGESNRPIPRDIVAFPSFVQAKAPEFSRPSVTLMQAPKAVGEVRHVSMGPLDDECDLFDRVVAEGTAFAERFLTAASPGIVCAAMMNEHYVTDDDYIIAVGEALRPEYARIVERGYLLQIDAPDLAMERHTAYADRSLAEFQAYVRRNIAAINRAIEGLPANRIRLHACWGNYEGPHHLDVDLDDILPLLYEAKVGALVLPFANPRHAHEFTAIERHPLPEGWLLVAGVIDTTTNYVEHPAVVAERLQRAAEVVGDPKRVLAGTDCGFGTAAGFGEVAEEVVWEKLRSLRAGADIASERLFA